jgi:alginate biosynthesis protein AlgX
LYTKMHRESCLCITTRLADFKSSHAVYYNIYPYTIFFLYIVYGGRHAFITKIVRDQEFAGPYKKKPTEFTGVEKIDGVFIRRYEHTLQQTDKQKALYKKTYPFDTPIFKYDENLPVCDIAKQAETYDKTKEQYKYVVQGKDGWLYRTVDFKTDFTIAPPSLKYFKRLDEILKSKRQILIVLLQPPRAVVAAEHIDYKNAPNGYKSENGIAGYKAFIKQLSEQGILAVDLSYAPSSPDYYQKGDIHWNYEGARWSAEQVSNLIKTLPEYNTLEKKDFHSEIISWEIPGRGTIEDLIQEICRYNIEAVSYPVWATTPVSGTNSVEESLLGEIAFPDITVVGTSNSYLDYKLNFVGALKTYLKADVYNAAIIGGGFGSSAFRYYASDEYHKNPPKIVIWEFLTQHNFNAVDAKNSFRQMIPAIQGACKKEQALIEFDTRINSFKTDFFKEMVGKNLKDSYLYIEATEPEGRSLRLEILYEDGEADAVDMSRNTRMSNNGKYYFELQDNTPLFFHLITDKAEGHFHARLCHYPQKIVKNVIDNHAL